MTLKLVVLGVGVALILISGLVLKVIRDTPHNGMSKAEAKLSWDRRLEAYEEWRERRKERR